MKSDTNMEMCFKSQLISLQKRQTKQIKKEKKGIAKYLSEDTDSEDSNDSLNDDGDDDLTSGGYLGGKSIMQASDDANHPSKLIDLELLNLLKFCGELHDAYKLNNEDYQEEIMMKSIELGKKQKQKVLVLDMDETMVSARFKSKMPPGFVTNFVVDF